MNAAALLGRPFPVVEHAYDARDCIRFALSVGVGMHPTDRRELRYVHEEWEGGLQVVPSMAAVLAYAGHWSRNPELGLDWRRIVHGEQRMRLHRPLKLADELRSRTRIVAIEDKGTARGALMHAERVITDGQGAPVATVTMITYARGDGGCGSHGETPPRLPSVPARPADLTTVFETSPQAGLLYRLQGDLNPLHADPAVAQAAGYPAPILHGLCSYGLVGWQLAELMCGGNGACIASLSCRFTAVVYPGDTLRTEFWGLQDKVAYRVTVPARGVVALDCGVADLI